MAVCRVAASVASPSRPLGWRNSATMISLRRFIRRDDGAVAVEMAFVSPFFLLLLFGIYDFGTLFVNSMEVEHAAQAGGDYAYNTFVKTGSAPSISTIQTAVTASTPLAVTVVADPARPSLTWTGCPD